MRIKQNLTINRIREMARRIESEKRGGREPSLPLPVGADATQKLGVETPRKRNSFLGEMTIR
ncbi:MAG: hypothetical protein HYW48_04025 [Deltaproteobacteria bacterium]|nr:hypothetical protein [Deltaproteobacteria bacterium]